MRPTLLYSAGDGYTPIGFMVGTDLLCCGALLESASAQIGLARAAEGSLPRTVEVMRDRFNYGRIALRANGAF